MRKTIILTLLVLLPFSHAMAQIGTWKNYLAYHEVGDIQKAGNTLYVLASNGLYTYNTQDHSILTYDKANYLSDCDINKIAWSAGAKKLIIVYKNGNIDLLAPNNEVTNMAEYYNYAMTQDKTVNHVYTSGNYAYMSTGFGIIKINVAEAEISDTYNLGFKVDYCYIDGQNIYAASSTNGLYKAQLTANLLNKNNWKLSGSYVARPSAIDPELLKVVSTLNPDGPKYNYFGFMKFANNRLYTCGGGWSTVDLMREGTIQVLADGKWQVYEDDIEGKTGYSYVDLGSIDIDPKNPEHVFAGGRTGIYEFNGGRFVQAYNNDNTDGGLQTAQTVGNNDKTYVICNTVKYDAKGSLWTFNSISPTSSLLEYTIDKKWINHHHDEYMYQKNRSLENVVNMMIDSRGLLWFVNSHWNVPSAYAYQATTDKVYALNTFQNQDGEILSITNVSCIAEDLNNDIWLATNIGPLLLEAKYIDSDSKVLTQVKVPRNDGTNLADYLLSNVPITCMAIDGAGRKWFGTSANGVYLISADNMTQIHHFTKNNSKLLSDAVESIAINNATGEVYFGTDKGLCSFMSDASGTAETMDKDNVYAYPNPVKPDFTGLITVKGLTLNADVKIVTSSGVLVAEGKSNGGTFTWDGNDMSGKRVASGVYMVQTATSEGKKGTVCKIAIVR